MKKAATTTSSVTAVSKSRREASPMASIPTNTNISATPAKQNTRSLMRSPSGSPLPNIELDPATIALIKENEQMLQTITVLQHELDKQKVRLSDVEADRANLANEVAELRSALGLATSEVTSSTGKVLNYKAAYLDMQDAFDKLKQDSAATKNKLEEATERERLRMLNAAASSTSHQRTQQKESFALVTESMKMPKSFLGLIQSIMAKLKDPAVRPADRRKKVEGDVERLEAKVAGYKPTENAAVAADGVPQLDVPIRQCVYDYLVVIVELLKAEVRQ
jgi:predicted  nucleic acid-binding Zn-ribbon protein